MWRRMPLALALALVPMPLAAQTPNWVEGPRTVSLGRVAELDLAEGYLFLGAKDAQALLERMGNVPDGSELGLVTSAAEGENWFVIFENRDVGFVKDDDKDEIDADAILAGISEATEESNEIRKEKGVPAIHVAGWEEPPSYDPLTHNLTWALLGRDDDGECRDGPETERRDPPSRRLGPRERARDGEPGERARREARRVREP